MPDDVVMYVTAGKHKLKHQRMCLDRAEQLGRVDSITTDLEAAVRLVEDGVATVLLCAAPSALGGRREEIQRRVRRAGGRLEYARPAAVRAAGSKTPDQVNRVIALLEESLDELRDLGRTVDRRAPERRRKRPNPRRQGPRDVTR